MKVIQYWKIIVLCVVSAFGNVAFRYLITDMANIPLYADTVFTVAMCFFAGLVPGLLTVGLYFTLSSIRYVVLQGAAAGDVWVINIFIICAILEVLVVCLYRRRMKSSESTFFENPWLDSFTGILVHLLILSVIACIAISIAGGIIDFVLSQFNVTQDFSPEDNFKLGLLRNNVNILATAILSRIPINIVDRFIVVFGGFAVSLLYRKLVKLGGKRKKKK